MTESFKGFKYPITKTSKGYFARTSGIDQIKSDLLILLLTRPGERVMLPDFGVPLDDILFDPNDEVVAEQAKQMISDAIRMWEPRVAVEQIEVSNSPDQNMLSQYDDLTSSGSILTIRIRFQTHDNIAETQDLVLEVPLPGGA